MRNVKLEGGMARDACGIEEFIRAECVRSIRRKYELCVMRRAGEHIYGDYVTRKLSR